jgi:hypothetical protein
LPTDEREKGQYGGKKGRRGSKKRTEAGSVGQDLEVGSYGRETKSQYEAKMGKEVERKEGG